MSEGDLEEEVTTEGRVVEREGAVLEDVVGEAVEARDLVEEVSGVSLNGRADRISPGLRFSWISGGTFTSVVGLGSSPEEESKGEQRSSGCVGSAGTGEGILWREVISILREKWGCPSDSQERATYRPRGTHLYQRHKWWLTSPCPPHILPQRG